jgi:hypothetical protein
MRVAILDDYQNVALRMADWSGVTGRAELTVFTDHLAERDAVVERLLAFDVICVMRERTALPRDVIEALEPRAVVSGHKPATREDDPETIEETRLYIRDFDRVTATTSTAHELYDQMLAIHPHRVNPGALWTSARAVKP